MLFCTEMHFSVTDKVIRRRFGFMFTYVGRAIFILLYVGGQTCVCVCACIPALC